MTRVTIYYVVPLSVILISRPVNTTIRVAHALPLLRTRLFGLAQQMRPHSLEGES